MTKSVDLDGTNEYFLLGDIADYNFEKDDSFSISGVSKTDAAAKNLNIMGKNDGASAFQGWILQHTATATAALQLWLISDVGATDYASARTTAQVFANDTWVWWAVTYNGSEDVSGMTFYVNGSAVAKTTVLDNLSGTIATTNPCHIGFLNTGSTQYWNGHFAEIGVYNKVLSSDEVSDQYNGGTLIDWAGLSSYNDSIGLWIFGNHPDDDATADTGQLTDRSTAGHNGTPKNTESGDFVEDVP